MLECMPSQLQTMVHHRETIFLREYGTWHCQGAENLYLTVYFSVKRHIMLNNANV